MLDQSEINKVEKDDHPFRENLSTQPIKTEKVFNRTNILTESWYPVCKSSSLKKAMARSFKILHQRIVVYRTAAGNTYALDSFCPHMGADLGNGEVIGEKIRCYFHHYAIDKNGKCSHLSEKQSLNSYPTQEKYGMIWVYAGKNPDHPVPHPPGLEGKDIESWHIRQGKLYAHHHVMMAGAIDLQHFKSVHSLDIQFDYDVIEKTQHSYCWSLKGILPRTSLLLKFGHWLTGGVFSYQALFAGGTITTLTYGNDLRFRGNGFKIPTINLFWGATPLEEGVSSVDIICVVPKYTGPLAPLKRLFTYLFSFLVLAILKDDDIKAFPHMRFQLANPSPKDKSILDLVDRINKLPISEWSLPCQK